MPTMLVEIAASRCPPASGVLLTTRCAFTSATPAPSRLARLFQFFCLLPATWFVGCSNLADLLHIVVLARRPLKAARAYWQQNLGLRDISHGNAHTVMRRSPTI